MLKYVQVFLFLALFSCFTFVNVFHVISGNPCRNYGTCAAEERGYVCQCEKGDTGTNCGSGIDHCTGVICVNGATCVNTLHTYTSKGGHKFYVRNGQSDDTSDDSAIAAFIGLMIASELLVLFIIFKKIYRIILDDRANSVVDDLDALERGEYYTQGDAHMNEARNQVPPSNYKYCAPQTDADSMKLLPLPLPTSDVKSVVYFQSTVCGGRPALVTQSSCVMNRDYNPGECYSKECGVVGSAYAMYYFRITLQCETGPISTDGKSKTQLSLFIAKKVLIH